MFTTVTLWPTLSVTLVGFALPFAPIVIVAPLGPGLPPPDGPDGDPPFPPHAPATATAATAASRRRTPPMMTGSRPGGYVAAPRLA